MQPVRFTATPPEAFRPLTGDGPFDCHWRQLPHWRQPGATYFATFRLSDALANDQASELDSERDEWKRQNPPPHVIEQSIVYHKRFTAKIERWLDEGRGSCLMTDPENSGIVEEVLKQHDGDRYQLLAWVVMPNHFHVLMATCEGMGLDDIWNGWKRLLAARLAKRGAEMRPIWFSEPYDRLVRDAAHLSRVVRYIGRNPAKAGLDPGRCLKGLCAEWAGQEEAVFGRDCG